MSALRYAFPHPVAMPASHEQRIRLRHGRLNQRLVMENRMTERTQGIDRGKEYDVSLPGRCKGEYLYGNDGSVSENDHDGARPYS